MVMMAKLEQLHHTELQVVQVLSATQPWAACVERELSRSVSCRKVVLVSLHCLRFVFYLI